MIILKLYTLFISMWFVWVQTIGRLTNGLSIQYTILFDIIFLISAFFIYKKSKSDDKQFLIKENANNKILNTVVILVLVSIIFTAIFQIPFDWDGNDYHLPPIIEALHAKTWLRSENPYFAARNYPKTASLPSLWWLIHFSSFLGLRGILLIPLLGAVIAWIAIKQLFPKINWSLPLLLAFPLFTKQANTFYADLTGLTFVLLFFAFLIKRNFLWSIITLALFTTIKFSNFASGFVLFISFLYFIFKHQIQNKYILSITASLIITLFSIIQPITNYWAEGRFFGPLKCTILGKDYCNGSITPGDLIVSPVIDIPKEDSYLMKIINGWVPNQFVPGSDVYHGGFGVISLLLLFTFLLFIFSSNRRKNILNYFNSDQKYIMLVLLFADWVVPGLWYCRYHMIFGLVLVLISSVTIEYLKLNLIHLYKIFIIILVVQLFWLIPNRNWFLGVHSFSEVDKVFDNIKHTVLYGTPMHATNPSDIRQIEFFKLKNKKITICGDRFRPILGAYGSSLTNKVLFICDLNASDPVAQIEQTKIWIENL